MLDYVIIGGGIAGLSSGAHLAPMGRVLVLEGEEHLGYHASGRSAALYEAEYGAPPTRALARASGDDLAAMGVLSPRGFMVVGRAQDEAVFARDLEELKLTRISVAEACARIPILNPAIVTCAGIEESAQSIDTDLLMQNYARQIRQVGGEIRCSAPVSALRKTSEGWEIQAAGETLCARRIVNAAGAWADAVARMAGVTPIGLQPYRRSMAQLPAPGGLDISRWPMVLGAGETWYAKPDAGKLLVSPADADPVEPHDAWADDMVLAEGLARYEEMVTEPVTRVETSWAGLRSYAPDKTLVLGPDAAEPDFIWCAGQGGQGFLSAPGAAKVLVELLGGPQSGQPDSILRAVAAKRFGA